MKENRRKEGKGYKNEKKYIKNNNNKREIMITLPVKVITFLLSPGAHWPHLTRQGQPCLFPTRFLPTLVPREGFLGRGSKASSGLTDRPRHARPLVRFDLYRGGSSVMLPR